MLQLNQKNLASLEPAITNQSAYDRNDLQPGIVHFGVGNFHRCHQAVYVEKLLNLGDLDWGIVGVSMRSAKVRDQLKPQDYLYTELTLSGETEFRIVGAILDILVAPEKPGAVIEQVAKSDIKLVTTTITEKGYCLTSGYIDQKHSDIVADKLSLDAPTSIYGYLAASLIRRFIQGGAPLSVLCCDNIQGGGDHLKSGVHMLLEQHSPETLLWVKENVSFASSMVDRVSPATDDSLIQLVGSKLGLDDAWPVSAEPFSQWVIEDNFAGQKPAFDKVGAQFARDISLYEQTKLRFLNAGHSIISVLGYLDNHATVHQALEQPSILDFASKALHENVLPVATMPENFSGEDYIADVIARFQNSALPYTVQQVNTDSSQKIQQRWFPTIDDALAHNTNTILMSFSVAAWLVYVQRALEAGELNDPLSNEFLAANQKSENIVADFLSIAGADRFNFFSTETFMNSVSEQYQTLSDDAVVGAINRLLSKQGKENHA